MLNKNILRKIPAILIMLAITVLSSLPGNDPLLKTFEFSDKLKHAIAYFVLGVSFSLWIPGKKWLAKPVFWIAIIVALCTAFGFLDEFHQSFTPGRSGCDSSSCEWGDIIANFSGGLIAAVAYCIATLALRRNI